jgi:hypothetical protein
LDDVGGKYVGVFSPVRLVYKRTLMADEPKWKENKKPEN